MENETVPLNPAKQDKLVAEGQERYEVDEEENVDETEKEEDNKPKGPKDYFLLVFFILLLQGIGCLFPYNAFISAPDYFNRIYGENTLFYITLAYSYPNLFGLIFMTAFGHKIPVFARTLICYVCALFILIAVPILGFVQLYNIVGLLITLTMVFCTALITAVVQSSIFGMGSLFPPQYMTAIMSGNGAAGLIVSIVRVITKLTIERAPDGQKVPLSQLTLSASIYFFISSATIFLCIVSFIGIYRIPFANYYLKQGSMQTKKAKKEVKPKEEEEDEKVSINNEETAAVVASEAQVKEIEEIEEEEEKKGGIVKDLLRVFTVFLKLSKYCFLIFFTFAVTLSIFPGLSSAIPSYVGGFMKEWLPVFLIVTFNLSDFIGRSAPSWVILFNSRWVGHITLLRAIFLPLFIVCVNPRYIFNDYLIIMLMFGLGITNGYCSTLIMMYAPSNLAPKDREIGGTMMSLFLLLGITVGANMGLLWSNTILVC